MIIIAGFFAAMAYDAIGRYWQPYLSQAGFSPQALGYVFALAGAVAWVLLHVSARLHDAIGRVPTASLPLVEGLGIVLIW